MKLAIAFVFLFATLGKAGYDEQVATERSEATQLRQDLEEAISLSLRPRPVQFIDYWDQYAKPLPDYEIEYQGLRGFLYKQVASAARSYILKQVRANRNFVQNSFDYEAALRQDYSDPVRYGRTKITIGERYQVAKIWQVEIWNDGRLKWDKDEVEEAFKGLGQELGFEGRIIDTKDFKIRMTFTAKLKFDKIENSEVGCSVKVRLPWGIRLRLQGSAKGTGQAEASVQMILWQG